MKYFLLLISCFVLFLSCGKELETVTVKSNPFQPAERSDTTADAKSSEEEFIHIKMGEYNAIESLDPLFAESNSELRVLSIIYDGLTTLSETGEAAPALAKSWRVNNDSTTFTFTLRNDAFFYNSDMISSGESQKLTSADVKFTFERMASNQVPDYAANMFEDIVGFKAYHTELTYVKSASKRVLDSISGIEAQNDSTIVFTLESPSSDFLKKLAHPYASIYSKEKAASVNPPIQRAAGTGAFYFVTKTDSSHVFAINKNYFGEVPNVNRLDIFSGLSETNLFRKFNRGELHFLVELSPTTILTVADSAGNLSEDYADNNFTLKKSDVTATYRLFFNQAAGQNEEVQHLLTQLDSINVFKQTMFNNIQVFEPISEEEDNIQYNRLIIANTENPAELYLVNRIAEHATSLGFTIVMSPSFAVTERVTLSSRPFFATTKILEWYPPVFNLFQDGVAGVELQHESWNLNFSSISVSEDIQ